jgi:hypothetical protein
MVRQTGEFDSKTVTIGERVVVGEDIHSKSAGVWEFTQFGRLS